MAVAESPSGACRAGVVDPPLVVSQEGSRTVVTLRGDAGARVAADLAEALAAAVLASDGDVVVAVGGIGPIDPAVVAALAGGQRALRARSRTLLLRAPSAAARRLLDVCGLVAVAAPDPGAGTSADEVVPLG